MSASFPASKKTFSQAVNGVTKLVASLFNQPYDEIEAIETFIGSIGSAQSYSESIKNMLINYKRGCVVDWKGDADFYVRAGEIIITDASGNARLRRNTSDLTIDWSMIDTGVEASGTTYYVYAVADSAGTSFTVKISTNASAPSGATYYRKIGSFYNNAAGNITTLTSSLETSFGDGVSKSGDTVYQADSDGVLLGYMTHVTNGGGTAYVDSANPPTTIRCSTGINNNSWSAPMICFVRKGQYYKVTTSGGAAFNGGFFYPLTKV